MLTALAMIGMFLAFVVFCILFALGAFLQSDIGFMFVDAFNWATTSGIAGVALTVLFLVALGVVAFVNLLIGLALANWVIDRDTSSPWEPFIAAPLAFMWAPGILAVLWGEYKMIAVGTFLLFAIPVICIWWLDISEYMLWRRTSANEDKNEDEADSTVVMPRKEIRSR